MIIIILIIIILIGTTSNEIVMQQVAGLSCSGACGHERLCDTARGSRLQVQHTDRLARERVRPFGHTYERIAKHKIDANRLAVDPCEMKSLQAITIVM